SPITAAAITANAAIRARTTSRRQFLASFVGFGVDKLGTQAPYRSSIRYGILATRTRLEPVDPARPTDMAKPRQVLRASAPGRRTERCFPAFETFPFRNRNRCPALQ